MQQVEVHLNDGTVLRSEAMDLTDEQINESVETLSELFKHPDGYIKIETIGHEQWVCPLRSVMRVGIVEARREEPSRLRAWGPPSMGP
jgi:hypothetical protein